MGMIYTTDEIKAKLLPIFNSISVERAILFGSYAKVNPTKASDIDIVINSKGKIRGIDFFGVLEDITEALEIPVDLIEASQIIDGGSAQREITDTGVVIYQRT